MKKTSKKAFSLVELIVVVVIIGILSGVAYVGIQKAKSKTMNDKVLDDVIGIANALERYNQDHFGEYPVPDVDGNMNISCFYADATYAHDCDTSAFRQGMIDNNLLTRRYMPDVPTDPRTGSRYVYGVSTDGKYFMVGGIYEESDGSFVAKTAGNLKKGYHLPSLIRAFNGPNFVVEDGTNLPYSPDHLIITATLQNMPDSTKVFVTDGINPVTPVTDGMKIYTGYTVTTIAGGTVDIYYSDGSVSNLDAGSEMEILEGTEVEENDKDGIITKIRIKLTSGKIWNKVARLASASEFNVETTTAIAGVRGTEFGVEIINEATGEANILISSGEVCLGGTKDCDEPGAQEIVVIDTPVTKNLNTQADASSSGLETLMDTQSKRYLNDNIRPHILKADGLEITVANYREYYSLSVGDDLDILSLSAFEQGSDTSLVDIEFDTLSLEDDYVLTLTSDPAAPIVLRYIGLTGPDSGDSISITITTDTFLTEEDLYAVDEEVGEGMVEEESCAAADMIISGDIVFGAGLSTTVVWSATPQSCFEGETFNVYFDTNNPPGLDEGEVPNMQQLVLSSATAGDEYFWKVEVDGMTAVFDNGSKTAPTTPTWCGDSEYDPINEECDASNAAYEEGCNAPGADECKCNIDLGWKSVAGGGCECDTTITPTITLPENIDAVTEDNIPIPINSSLTWEVSPACAFKDITNHIIQIISTVNPSGPETSFSLTDSSGTINPGGTYNWNVKAFNEGAQIGSTAVGSFTVECPSEGDITNVIVSNEDTGYPIFDWEFDPPCTFDEIKPMITIDLDGQSVTNYGDTHLEWGSLLSSGTYNYTLSSSVSTDIIDNFTIASSAVCGDGTVDAGEQCDDGKQCLGGTYDGSTCTGTADCDSYPCEPQDLDGCDALCQWEPIVEIEGFDAGKPYYAVGSSILLLSKGFDAGFNLNTNTTIAPMGAGLAGGYFIASVPGEYELHSSYVSDSYTLFITVCGYVGDGSECWVLGSESGPSATDYGQSCDDVCTPMGLSCDDTATTINTDICTGLGGTSVGGGSTALYAPLISSSECNSATVATDCTVVSENIFSVITTSRMCKCNLP